jgi:hypothetical protein
MNKVVIILALLMVVANVHAADCIGTQAADCDYGNEEDCESHWYMGVGNIQCFWDVSVCGDGAECSTTTTTAETTTTASSSTSTTGSGTTTTIDSSGEDGACHGSLTIYDCGHYSWNLIECELVYLFFNGNYYNCHNIDGVCVGGFVVGLGSCSGGSGGSATTTTPTTPPTGYTTTTFPNGWNGSEYITSSTWDGLIPTPTNSELPNASQNGSILNQSGWGTNIGGFDTRWVLNLIVLFIMGVTLLVIGSYDLRAGLVAAAMEADFFTIVMVIAPFTGSVLLLLNVLAVLSFFARGD